MRQPSRQRMHSCTRSTTSGDPAGHDLLGRSGPYGRQPTGQASTSSGGSGRRFQRESPRHCVRCRDHLQHGLGCDARERLPAYGRNGATARLRRERHRCGDARQVRPAQSGRLRARWSDAEGRPWSPPCPGSMEAVATRVLEADSNPPPYRPTGTRWGQSPPSSSHGSLEANLTLDPAEHGHHPA